MSKREHKIQSYIDLDRAHLTTEKCSMLVRFLRDVVAIIKQVANAQTTKQLTTKSIQMLRRMYSYWTENDLLPEDSLAEVTLLDRADEWLTKGA